MDDELKIAYVRDAAGIYAGGPSYATEGSAGMDLRACLDGERLEIAPGCRAAVPAGIRIETPSPGIAGFVYSRSGLGAVKGLAVAQGVGVIDPDYRGEIIVWLLNTSKEPLAVCRGDRIAQLVFQPVFRLRPSAADGLTETQRGAGGFGHTGQQ